IVKLTESTRQAQVGDSLFPTLEQVPHYAFTLTLPTLFAAAQIYCFALGTSKAKIVRQLLTGEIDSACPASWLRRHANATLFLDAAAASLLD
ncbi:MAG: glucosamine-6-phosphate deaminase, partial [Chloroflexaceae bacterium]|nr:glucosamine-6-phosphate deaminase [Chloroflexaceae bacterium]